MFGYIVAGITALAFGGIAYREATKTTGEKVRNGDKVFVHGDAIHLAEVTSPADQAALQTFLAGFFKVDIGVTEAQLIPNSTAITGTIIGFPKRVAFDRSAVVSIERNGARIV